MQINWFTVIAQIINFFALVYLLKRYLYKPVLKAIDERENKITSQLKDAEAKKADAEKEKEDYRIKNKEFDQQKAERMNEVLGEVNAERQRQLEDARAEYNTLKSKLEKSLQEEDENMNHEIAILTHKEVYSVAGKVLKELANSSLEENIIQIFIKQLHGLKEDDIKKLKSSDKAGIIIRTAFELTHVQQNEIKNEISKITGKENPFVFEVKSELVSGIELTVGGFKLSWSIEHYLNAIQKDLKDLLQKRPLNTK